MMRSLFSGISGLRNFQNKMDVIGNNIANVNTLAFKGSRITFADTIAQTLAGESAPTTNLGGINPLQIGLGMRTMSIDTNFGQGSLESTGNMTDLAIQGNGFFMVTDGNQTLYTRAGAFSLDANGNLVMNGNGQKVMGYLARTDQPGTLDRTGLKAITIPLGKMNPPKATTEVQLRGNLDMRMSDSIASLINAGTTGVTNISGTASDGVGGRHNIVITGANATRSSDTGTVTGLNLTDSLGTLGVTDTSGFQVVVDGDRTVNISGLSTTSTVNDLINAINNQVSGVKAELDGTGAIAITRQFYGDGATYNVELRDTGACDVVNNLLNGTATFTVNNGTASTLVAVDQLTSNATGNVVERALTLEFDARTGLVNNIRNIGGSGIAVSAPGGLDAGTLVVDTADTVHSTPIMVYDSLGNTSNLTVKMTRTENPGVWRWSASVQEPATLVEGGTGTITFNTDGSLESFTYDNNLHSIKFNPGNGAETVDLALNAGTLGSFEGLTQTSSPTTALASRQDGYASGSLQGIYIDNNGRIYGNFSNGQTELLSQLMLANFNNPQGLDRVGDNLYAANSNTGTAQISEAAAANATVNAGYLEMSNVDLSREFTEMIMVQRAFQASSRVITTSDYMLEEVTRLKR